MKWTDLMPGDKVKFTKECIRFYHVQNFHWKNSVENKIFTISKVENYGNVTRIWLDYYIYSYVDMLHNGRGSAWNFDGELLELVEIC